MLDRAKGRESGARDREEVTDRSAQLFHDLGRSPELAVPPRSAPAAARSSQARRVQSGQQDARGIVFDPLPPDDHFVPPSRNICVKARCRARAVVSYCSARAELDRDSRDHPLLGASMMLMKS